MPKNKVPYDSILNILSVVSDLSTIVTYLKLDPTTFQNQSKTLKDKLLKLEQRFEKYKVFLDMLTNKVIENQDKTGIFDN